MNSGAAFIHTHELDRGGYPEACPFNSTRAGRTLEMVRRMNLLGEGIGWVEPPVRLTREEMAWFHEPAYLEALAAAQAAGFKPGMEDFGLGTPDCPVFDGMFDFVALAAGGTMTAARLLLEGKTRVAFNPSGGFHHAMPAQAAGFCYVNDIVLAVEALRRAGKRVAFLDIDVHHCDGVQRAFYTSPDVLLISLHETGRNLFPGTGFETEIGAGAGRGYTVNVPLPVGTYDEAYKGVFYKVVLPLIKRYAPDVLVVEIGMDALAGDPLAHLHLTNNVHADLLSPLVNLGIPLLATGGGGYNIKNTVRGWALAWSVLCGEDHTHDLSIGLGGVMLENTDWFGGLRDRVLLSDAGRRADVADEIARIVTYLRQTVFPIHGLE